MRQTEPSEELLLEYIRGDAAPDVRARIERWTGENPDNESMLLNLAKIYHAHRLHERIGRRNAAEAYEKVMRALRRRQRAVRLSWRRIAAAASVLVAANIAAWCVVEYRVPSDACITLNSNAEKKVEYTLPDGTTVFLNRNSSLRFPVEYAEDSRCVKLDGEAYFEVAHDPGRPFVVTTDNDMRISVLGTRFNVEAYASDSIARVTLLEGRVGVRIDGDASAERDYLLSPSEELRYNAASGRIVRSRDTSVSGIEWMDNTFVFRDMPFPEVVRRLSRNFGVEFVIRDVELTDYAFTGTFDNRDLTLILEYMQISSGIDVMYQTNPSGGQRIVLGRKTPNVRNRIKQPMNQT